MNKKKLIIIIITFAFFLLVIVGMLIPEKKVDESELEEETQPTITLLDTPTPLHLPTDTYIPTPFPDADKVEVSEVEVNNFFKSAVRTDPQGAVVIYNEDDFQIVYLSRYEKFKISILGSPFDEYQTLAEEVFLSLLSVSKSEACKLNVVVNTPRFANPEMAGEDFGLSWCE